MDNTELTLDQLKAISGGVSNTRLKKPSYNLKEMADTGTLLPKQTSLIPDPMYRWIPGEMY